MHPSCFLPTSPSLDVPLPSAGFPWAGFPCFVGTIRTLRLPAVPPAALRFLRLAVPRTDACGFAATGGKRQTPVTRGSWVTRIAPLFRGLRAETTGPPTFLGNPDCAYALLFDPGRTDHTRPFSVPRHGPRSDHDEGSCGNCLSRLNHTAWALAVYASQGGLLHHHARLASGCRPSSTGRA